MAEAIVSVVLEQLASITFKQIEEEVKLIVGVDKEVENLILHLNAVQAVLQDAEQRQVNEANVRNWLSNLEDLSYQISDVLDEWNTEILKNQIEKEEKQGETLVPTKKKVRFFIPSPINCFRQISDQVIRRPGIGRRIREINERLSWIAILRQNYQFKETPRNTEPLERPNTSSFVNVSHIVGRKREKEDLIKMLSESSTGEGTDRFEFVVAIVGMGGMGKTALAQLVYNDVNVKFEKKIWVCVSDPFGEIKIAKAIIQVLDKQDPRINSPTLQPLLECINENIIGKKFLLVLDDVWNPTNNRWEALNETLKKGDRNSRILVTTRNTKAASVLGATTNHIINLNHLSDQDCLLLFRRIAFLGKEKEESKFLVEDIKEKILKKCNGLPLAIKTLASLLQYKKTRKEWLDVLDTTIGEIEEVDKQVFQSLLLSYYDLAPVVRRCLLYCATFPKNYVFNKNNLIELWMSQEYLSIKGDKEKEMLIGQIYFDNLVMRSFFQDFVEDENGINIVECKMHDIVHDFVQFMTKNECAVVEVNSVNALQNNKVRHLNLLRSGSTNIPASIYNCKRLRTLIASDSRISLDLLLQLKCLRTLDLSNGFIVKLPREIGVLIHLRYLNLSRNPLKEVPNTVGNLYNLQTLRLHGCWRLKKLPVTIRKLINLKCLYIDEDVKLPKGIGRLRSLQTLGAFKLYDDDDNQVAKLGDLRDLDQLQGSLCIKNLWSVKDVNEAKNAKLVNKKYLLHLDLKFECRSFECEEGEQRKMEQILDALQPHKNLESLTIFLYPGTTLACAKWMVSLQNLKKLHIDCVPFCKYVAPLGKLPALEHLHIERARSLRKVGVEFLGIDERPGMQTIISFPKLKKLRLEDMDEWEEWEGVQYGPRREEEHYEIKIMPSLSVLEFRSCPCLKMLPLFLWETPLQKLSISDSWFIARYFGTETDGWFSRITNINIEPATTEE